MRHTAKPLSCWLAILAVLGLSVVGVTAADPPAAGPIIGPTSWTDLLNDSQGISSLDNTRHGAGEIKLSQVEALDLSVGEINSFAEGPGLKFYLGADNAELWSYDTGTGQLLDLGAPVPDECST